MSADVGWDFYSILPYILIDVYLTEIECNDFFISEFAFSNKKCSG